MTFSYKRGTLVGQVRFELGDTNQNQHLVEDEDIEHALDLENNVVLRAAARICDMLATRFASKEDFRVGTAQVSKNTISAKFINLANRFRARSLTTESFVMPALSRATKETHTTDTDIPQPAFSRGMQANPEADTGEDDPPLSQDPT